MNAARRTMSPLWEESRPQISTPLCKGYDPEDCRDHLLSIRSVINDAMQRTATPLLQASAHAVDRAISASDMATKHGASRTDITNFATLMLSANALLQDAASGIDVDESLWCGAALMLHVAASARALIEGDTIAAGVAHPVGQAPRTDETTKAIVEEAWVRTGEAIGVFDAAFLAFKSEPIRPVMQKARMACDILSGELDPDPDRFPRMDQCRTALQILSWAHTELDRLIADGSDGEEGDSPAGTAARTGGLTLLGLAVAGLEQAVGTPSKTEQPARNDAPAFRATAPAKAQPADERGEIWQTLEGVLHECERNTQHALGTLEEAAERLDDNDLRSGADVVRSAHTAACQTRSDEGTAADCERLEALLKEADASLQPVAESLGDDAVSCAADLVSLSHRQLRDTALASMGLSSKHAGGTLGSSSRSSSAAPTSEGRWGEAQQRLAEGADIISRVLMEFGQFHPGSSVPDALQAPVALCRQAMKLLDQRPQGRPTDDDLEEASLLVCAARAVLELMNGHHLDDESLYGAHTLLGLAKGLIDDGAADQSVAPRHATAPEAAHA